MKPDDSNKPSNPGGEDVPQTGDPMVLWPWVVAMVLSALGILITLTLDYRSRHRYKGKHFKR